MKYKNATNYSEDVKVRKKVKDKSVNQRMAAAK